jgi:radical SAM superfamily enzyme YgiQ (UPF0313 family)
MKVLFIQDNLINESPAIWDISGLLKSREIEVELFIENQEKNFWEKISKYSPDIFIIPADIGGEKWAEEMLKKIKKFFKKQVVLCGTYPTFVPEIIEKKEVEIIVRGEADFALLELLENLKERKDITSIRNLSIKKNGKIFKNPLRPLIENLDILPLPDRSIYFKYKFLREFPLKKITSGRGCPNSCSFCYNRNFKEMYRESKVYVRRKSVERTLKEIEELVKNYSPVNSLHFSDDLFTDNKEWVIEFCKKYRDFYKIPFTCNTTVDRVDEEMVYYLKSANCSGIAVGIETGNENLRTKLLNKPYTTKQIIEVAKLIKKYKITLTTFNMICLPSETIEEAFQTVSLNREIRADNPRVNIAFAIPKTNFTEEAIKKGYLSENFNTRIDLNISKPVFRTKYYLQFENLYYLFWLATKSKFWEKVVRFLINLKLTKLYKIFILFRFLEEKKFFKIGFISAIKLYLNCGNPLKRTKNFNNFIP